MDPDDSAFVPCVAVYTYFANERKGQLTKSDHSCTIKGKKADSSGSQEPLHERNHSKKTYSTEPQKRFPRY
jgi:hypothetical protein